MYTSTCIYTVQCVVPCLISIVILNPDFLTVCGFQIQSCYVKGYAFNHGVAGF